MRTQLQWRSPAWPGLLRLSADDNGHNLVGWIVKITQEDESTALAVVTNYNPSINHHVCTAQYGTADAQVGAGRSMG